jgi:MFS family permease
MTAGLERSGVDSPYAWRLAFVSMFCIGLGGGALYLPVIGLKEIAAEFGDRRAVPSMAYMLGFFFMGIGGVLMGWLADRTSPRVPLMIAGVSIAAGGWLAASGGELALYAGYAIPLGFLGNAATFTPAMNNIQGWFNRRRSTAVSIISVGPAVSGFVWPQVYRWLLPDVGWRETLVIYGVVAGTLLFVCAFYVRPSPVVRRAGKRAAEDLSVLPMPSLALMGLLSAAGFCCCVAMAIPFVHMVAFCGDLGFAAARGSEAISLILLTAVASTFAMGRLADFRHLHPVGDPRHSLHRHRAGLRPHPALPLRALDRRLAAGRGHAVRHGRHGGRRLAGRRHLRRHAVLPLGLPGGAGLQPLEPHAARHAAFRTAPPYLCVVCLCWERLT